MAKLSQSDAAYVLAVTIEVAAFMNRLPLNLQDRDGNYPFDIAEVCRLRAVTEAMREKLLRVIPQPIEIEESAA